MNFYKEKDIQNIKSYKFDFIELDENDHVFTITLNRPKKKNALHPQMMNEIAFAMHYAHFNNSIWVVVFRANGDVFCAGGDLKAMMGDVEPYQSTVPVPEKEVLMGELFNSINKPTISLVEKNVYAGGFLIVAGSLYVIAEENLRFSLPEVKRGLFPMQVMASLIQVMPPRKVLDWCVRGYSISAIQAKEQGLVTHISNQDNIENELSTLIKEILDNSPTAIRNGLEAYGHITNQSNQHEYLLEMLNKVIKSNDANEGFNAFKEKRKPHWTGS